jgi:LysM repeat protein
MRTGNLVIPIGTKHRLARAVGLIFLAAGTLACSLSAQRPTPPPTQTPIVITITQSFVSATPLPTFTALPTATSITGGSSSTTVPCLGAPASWVAYIVQPGDTLGLLAQRTGATITQLASANCISNPNVLSLGQVIRLPRLPIAPTITPQPQPVIRWGGNPPNLLCHVVPVVANAALYSDPGLITFRAFLGDWAPWVENTPWGGIPNGAYRVQLPDGTTAWIAAQIVQLRGNCGIVPPATATPVPPTFTPTLLPFPESTPTP